jgi:hypothetical protein
MELLTNREPKCNQNVDCNTEPGPGPILMGSFLKLNVEPLLQEKRNNPEIGITNDKKIGTLKKKNSVGREDPSKNLQKNQNLESHRNGEIVKIFARNDYQLNLNSNISSSMISDSSILEIGDGQQVEPIVVKSEDLNDLDFSVAISDEDNEEYYSCSYVWEEPGIDLIRALNYFDIESNVNKCKENNSEVNKQNGIQYSPSKTLNRITENQKCRDMKILKEKSGYSRLNQTLKVIPWKSDRGIGIVKYYKITGTLSISDDITHSNITRRYNDFKCLHILLENTFYYKILPFLPEKSIKIKFISDENIVIKRSRELEIYIKKLMLIDELAYFAPFVKFLTDQKGFECLYHEKDICQILKSSNMFSLLTKRISNAWKTISRRSCPVKDDKYSSITKEIDCLGVFISNMSESYKSLENNCNNIFKYLNRLSENCSKNKPQIMNKIYCSDVAEFSTMNSKRNSHLQTFDHLIEIFEKLSGDLHACKEGLMRKDRIYAEHDNLFVCSNTGTKLEESCPQAKESKLKIEKLENYFKQELCHKIQAIKSTLEEIIGGKIEQLFMDFFQM